MAGEDVLGGMVGEGRDEQGISSAAWWGMRNGA